MEIQIFGIRKNPETRKALRFFAERRIKTHFVDLAQRPASRGELQRFVQKFGISAIIDRGAKRFGELGLQHAQIPDERWVEKLIAEPLLLKLPLVRNSSLLSVGDNEVTWTSWVKS